MSIPVPHDPDAPELPLPVNRPKVPLNPADCWRPLKPGFDVNGLGQLRTSDHKPPSAPVML